MTTPNPTAPQRRLTATPELPRPRRRGPLRLQLRNASYAEGAALLAPPRPRSGPGARVGRVTQRRTQG